MDNGNATNEDQTASLPDINNMDLEENREDPVGSSSTDHTNMDLEENREDQVGSSSPDVTDMDLEKIKGNQIGSSSPEMTDIELEKIRGDAIGDTVYSERYVLKILIQLSQYDDEKWNEELESDLSTLWDMTVTPSVVEYLIKHETMNLILPIIQNTSKPRLTEILVGMIANFCCVKEVRATLSENKHLIDLITEMSFSDSLTLVQLTRCYQSFVWDLRRSDVLQVSEQHWFEKHIVSRKFSSQIMFILANSLCEELLIAVLDLLNTLCGMEIHDKDYSRYFASSEMIEAMLESWKTLFTRCKDGKEFEFPNRRLEKTALHWVSVLLAFAGYEEGRQLLGAEAKKMTKLVLHFVQVPQDSYDSLLICSISLLEALVGSYFCQEAFCKTIRVVRKTSKKRFVLHGNSEDDSGRALSVLESFGNYCVEVLKRVDHLDLNSVLSSRCSKQSAKFFTKIVKEREPDCIIPSQ